MSVAVSKVGVVLCQASSEKSMDSVSVGRVPYYLNVSLCEQFLNLRVSLGLDFVLCIYLGLPFMSFVLV